MERRSRISGSCLCQQSQDEGEYYYYCELKSTRPTLTSLIPRRFHGCTRDKKDLKSEYFKYADAKFLS